MIWHQYIKLKQRSNNIIIDYSLIKYTDVEEAAETKNTKQQEGTPSQAMAGSQLFVAALCRAAVLSTE